MSDPYNGLLTWLQQGARTFGWGCLIAWDRNRLNRLLLQNYVDNVDSDSYLPPFEDVVFTSDVTAELIYDYTLDYPRLSFENASLTDSRARLRMKVVRGSQLSVEQHQDGSPRLAKVSEINVLNGPTLSMNLALNRMPGTVGSAGKLILNIAEGSSFDMGFADTPQERSLGGEYFRKKFELLDDDQKIFVLGEMSVPNNRHFLKPADFRVRIHRNPGDPAEGAVLLMVRMEGDENGREPPTNDGMRYLLVAGHSFAMLLSHDVMISKLFTRACGYMTIGGTPFEARTESPAEGATHYLHGTAGTLSKYSMSIITATFKPAAMQDVQLPLVSASTGFKLTFKGSDIHLEWSGEHESGLYLDVDFPYRTSATIRFTFERAYRLELNRSEGLVSFVQVPQDEVSSLSIRITDGLLPSDIVTRFNIEVAEYFEQELFVHVQSMLQRFEVWLEDIAVGPMTSLLFGDSEHLELEYVDFCRDMAIFGKLSPWQTTFFVQPMEVVLGPGSPYWFTTSSLRDVIWSVENLPGESGPVGMITPLGFYHAPHNVPGRFLRVKVSATARSDGFTSSALVTVMNSLISISPQVMVHSAGSDRGREMRAGSYQPGELTWEVLDPSSGARIVPSTAEDGDHTYFPGPVIPGTSFSIDEIKVSNRFGSQSAYVLVTHFPMGLVVKAQRIGNGETVQLKGYNGGADIPDTFRREWKVLLGGGTVDATSGVFTPGAESSWLFSIVTLKVWITETVQSEGYILLPLPYIDISEIDWKPSALNPNN